ncbi:O-antigen ligase family protein [Candidatus Parcubacteria bacterium]|nr:O-antigen ligase family protein [Candidatus Parcubacteria bacterium]
MLIALIAFVISSYKRTIWGVAIIVALLPTYLWRVTLFNLPSTFLELMIISLFVIWLLKGKRITKINFSLSKKAYNVLPVKWRYLLVTWLLVSILALVINFTYTSLGLWRAYWLEPIMFFLVFIYSVKSRQDIINIIKALGVLVIWLLITTMYQNFSDWNFIAAYNPPNIKRLTGVFSYPNALALLVAPITALFFGLWAYSKNKLKEIIYLIAFIAGLILALLSRSDGAILALGLSILLWLILAKKIRKIGIPLVIMTLIAIVILPTEKIESALTTNINPKLDLQSSSVDIRLNQWQETTDMLQDNLIFGLGIDGYQDGLLAYHQYQWLEIYLYPHNIFLNFWTELGLAGLIVFLLILISIIYLLKRLFANRSVWAWPLSMMWLTWFIHGLVDVPYFKNDLSVLFFIMLGLTLVVQQDKKIK